LVEIGSHDLFPPVGFELGILLISAFQVARITGMSYRHLTEFSPS
jgi:hypothetical protein